MYLKILFDGFLLRLLQIEMNHIVALYLILLDGILPFRFRTIVREIHVNNIIRRQTLVFFLRLRQSLHTWHTPRTPEIYENYLSLIWFCKLAKERFAQAHTRGLDALLVSVLYVKLLLVQFPNAFFHNRKRYALFCHLHQCQTQRVIGATYHRSWRITITSKGNIESVSFFVHTVIVPKLAVVNRKVLKECDVPVSSYFIPPFRVC